MGILGEIVETCRDTRELGFGFAVGGLRRFVGRDLAMVRVPGIGSVHIRRQDSDFDTIRQVFRGREYQIDINAVHVRLMERYENLLATGQKPVIIDAGANIGAASLWFHQQYPKAHVVAIEPDADNFAVLRHNTHHLDCVTLIPAAVGSQRGTVKLIQPGLSWAVQVERGHGETPIVTMQDAVDSVPNGALFIAKIDIEGFEDDLFASNTDWVDSAELIALEPHDWMMPGRGTSRTFQDAIGRRGFEMYLRGENVLYVRMEPRKG